MGLVVLYLIVGFFVLGCTACVLLGWYLFRRIVHHKHYTPEFTWNDGLAKGEIWPEFPTKQFEQVRVKSFDDCELSVVALPGELASHTIIFSHGVSWNWYGAIKYMPSFLARKWNIIAFDHRNHGQSGGNFKSFGVVEKHDLKAVADYAYQRFPQTKILGVHAESMGAAIAAAWNAFDSRATFLALDSCFSDLEELLKLQLGRAYIPGFLHRPILLCSQIFSKTVGNFVFKEISPRSHIALSNTPIIFFHAKTDALTPYTMSVELANCRSTNARTATYFTDEGIHSRAILVDRAGYEAKMWDFIDSVTGTTHAI